MCIHSLAHRLIVTYLIPFHKSTASLQTLGDAHRLELKRMNARLSSSHSSFNIYTQNSCGEKKKYQVSLFLLREEAKAERTGWQPNSSGEWKRFFTHLEALGIWTHHMPAVSFHWTPRVCVSERKEWSKTRSKWAAGRNSDHKWWRERVSPPHTDSCARWDPAPPSAQRVPPLLNQPSQLNIS